MFNFLFYYEFIILFFRIQAFDLSLLILPLLRCFREKFNFKQNCLKFQALIKWTKIRQQTIIKSVCPP